MMTIGEFALSTGLSVKALRFYDERGLLAPADVDPHSGYRRYSAAQLRTATTIRILRTAGLSVEDVKTALDEPGLRIETGTLPKREEAFVTFSVSDDSTDMLSDAPGGPLAPEELIALSEFLEARGLDSAEMLRQRAVGDQPADESMPVVAEAAVTVATLG